MYSVFVTSELKKWMREPLTSLLVFYPLVFALVGRYLLPMIEENTGFPFIDLYADVIVVTLALIMPLVFGALIGFSILDDRDDNVLPSVRVTPLGLNRFFSFRLIMIFIFSTAACIFVILFAGIGELPLGAVVSISILASLSAPMTGLFINSFASNKIEGFAVMKGFGAVIFFPIIALFLTGARELVFAFAPGFFPAKAISALIRGEGALFLTYNQYYLLGWVYGIALNLGIYRLFMRRGVGG